jgi:plastocyanin
VDGEEFVAIATGGNQSQGSSYGDAVWTFSLKGQLGPLWPPPPPQTVAGPTGPITVGVDAIKIGANNTEYTFAPARTRIKSGTTVSFSNVGDIPHDASALQKDGWSTGALAKGETKTVTFDKPGIYYYICTPHPWMYGQIIVERPSAEAEWRPTRLLTVPARRRLFPGAEQWHCPVKKRVPAPQWRGQANCASGLRLRAFFYPRPLPRTMLPNLQQRN